MTHTHTATPDFHHSPPVIFSHVLTETYKLLPVAVPSVFLGNGKVAHVRFPLLGRLLEGRRMQRRGAKHNNINNNINVSCPYRSDI